MEISRGFEKFTYYRGFRGIEDRITEVLLYKIFKPKPGGA
jgi:hypothetical protein